jgi:acid phosphatase family membrane protein YuiD
LLEAIGHTPLEALGGVLLGVVVSLILWFWLG